MPTSKKGFTLIEILVVISIISVLTVISMAAFGATGSKARDSKRKSDIKSIAYALEIYYQKNGRYPCAFIRQTSNGLGNWLKDSNSGVSGAPYCQSGALGTEFNSDYIKTLPDEPLSSRGDPYSGNFGYSFETPDNCPGAAAIGQYYRLSAILENADDSESNKNMNYKDCMGSSLPPSSTALSTSPLKDNLYVITSK
jgi:prepilin-type N-terminal cleavage/methylation domain-containing protein